MNIVNSINFFRKKENFFYLLLCLYPWLLISGPFLSDSVAIILSINYLFIKISSRKFDDFKNADTVILCPIHSAGEKIKLGFNYNSFAKEIIKNSKVKLFLVNDKNQLAKFLKKNMYGKKIVIGMGAGSISNWMRELPKLMK